MKRVLMIAYHFPPMRGSSGIQRTLRFVQHLPGFGWEPLVLTAHPRAYEQTSSDQLHEIPAATIVQTAFALDTRRHLAIAGRYPKWLALPDRWASWYPGGVLTGLNMIRRYRPDVIWSTFPIATAHRIGHTLARRSGLPWIADFRDPMAHEGFPPDPAQWRAYQQIESQVLQQASLSVFATPGAAHMYAEKYPSAATRIRIIENGYDEESFARAERQAINLLPENKHAGRFVLLHSGVIYPSERDPRPLFIALARLKARGILRAENFSLRLRASGAEEWLARLVAEHHIADLVTLEPPISYEAALQEMLSCDGLLILQASNCNQQIPAKLYEYLRSRKPILALTDMNGDTAQALLNCGLGSIASLDNAGEIESRLPAFIERTRSGVELPASPQTIAEASRLMRTARLAQLLDEVAS